MVGRKQAPSLRRLPTSIKSLAFPRPALWLTFALSIFWTLPFPSWEQLISVVSAALVLSYAIAPVTAAGLRRNAPDLPRPFRVRAFGIIGPVSFVISALIVFWSGTGHAVMAAGTADCDVCRLCALQIKVPVHTVSLAQQVEIVSVAYRFLRADYTLLTAGQFWGHRGDWSSHWDTVVVAVIFAGNLLLG